VFEAPQAAGHVSVFVNYCLALHQVEMMEELIILFWEQMDRIRPESYVADNDYLNFVTMDKILFERVLRAAKSLG
jgi:hypothetical protein